MTPRSFQFFVRLTTLMSFYLLSSDILYIRMALYESTELLVHLPSHPAFATVT